MTKRKSKSVKKRRPRRASPNSNQKEPSSKEDEVPVEKIRVGRDFQVSVPDLIPFNDRKLDLCPEKALLVWSPTTDIPEEKLEDYISRAKEKYGYNGEQALGMLFWHKHNLERAESDLVNYLPYHNWPEKDQVLLEQKWESHKIMCKAKHQLSDIKKGVLTV